MSNTNTVQEITLTPTQQAALDKLVEFIENDKRVFILKGYAGTGKTTLMRKLISVLQAQKRPYLLWASTGRAAKILSNVTGSKADTIHSGIYYYTDFNQDLEEVSEKLQQDNVDKTGQLFLKFELASIPPEKQKERTIYIVDESSMIADMSDVNTSQAMFGSGRLLNDMLAYDTNGKFIFVGDICQLPPVKQDISPALNPHYFQECYRLEADEAELREIMRQAEGNDIIHASKRVRELYFSVPKDKWGKLPLKGYRNIKLYPETVSIINAYIRMVKKNGFNEATMLCRSNKRNNELTEILRPAMGKTGEIKEGDLLLVTQNNYISGLMNGDMVTVEQIDTNIIQRAGLSFRGIRVKELFTGKTYQQLLLEDVLYSHAPNLNAEQQKALFIDFFRRMKAKGIRQNHPVFKEQMFTDPYLNALRTSYGYALTCHKAQGGEWNHVFLDIPRNLTLHPTPAVYQWVYTAMTRARVMLHIVNDFFIQ